MAVPDRPWHVGEPGGPSGPFYSLVNGQGQIVAMQIPSREIAEFIAAALARADAAEAAIARALNESGHTKFCRAYQDIGDCDCWYGQAWSALDSAAAPQKDDGL